MPSPNIANYTGTPPPPAVVAAAADKFLPALHHAVSGSAGTLISTCTLYPLSLAITRLQAQRHFRREERLNSSSSAGDTTPTGPAGPGAAPDPTRESTHAGITGAFSRIWNSGGGPRAIYTGLAQDAARSVLDSFLFFLFYEWFRSVGLAAGGRGRRRRGDRSVPGLGVLEQLAIGVAAGACSRLLTTPIANVVARKQPVPLIDGEEVRDASVREIVEAIRKEQDLAGFWSGYSASLVLTLNPSITFFLQEFLKKKTVSADRWDNPGAHITFLLAAISKTIASTITYPLQTAETRLQNGIPIPAASESSNEDAAQAPEVVVEAPTQDAQTTHHVTFDEAISPKTEVPRKVSFKENVAPPERIPGAEGGYKSDALRAVKDFGKSSVFGATMQIARAEGVGALYDGILGELIKGFLGHGATMLAKDVVHRLLFKLYFVVAGVLAEIRARRARARAGVRDRTEARAVVRPVTRTETRTETVVETVVGGSPEARRIEAGPEPKAIIETPVETRPKTPPSPTRMSSPPPSPPSSLLESPPSPPPSLPQAPTPPPLEFESESEPPSPFALPPPPPPPRQPSPPPPQRTSPSPLRLASLPPRRRPPTPPPSSPQQHQLHSLRDRHDNAYDRYRYERLPSPPPTPYPAAGYGYRWSSPRKRSGARSFLAENDGDEGGSVVANMIDRTQRGVKYY
ncbi:mitochondrial carrier domain-containing protein [Daldinia vernicosa]|uniref:mitochondrial carrier domain-containing protein n=1 Tax=Daldinia vernicosa TaxID=114800 RepID=UPI0020077367|nr:mitochondrial carrier domain-containing protein [Daldinia vernicosa]KAI0851869.1 mitochondrial carrier domain-containing protein [Daldinia vernicosa]